MGLDWESMVLSVDPEEHAEHKAMGSLTYYIMQNSDFLDTHPPLLQNSNQKNFFTLACYKI